ncbi:MAG: AarF/UbiB family protein [Pirellula sp.]|jgi:ubiquinone biosynthesis protein|nr:AarF/UbiB family protein [Pirellula sp.]
MRLTSLPRYYRNLRRWQEIIVVLRRYGLADWLSRLRVDFIRDWLKDDDGVPLSSYSRSARVRMALTDLGPTFIKLGQVLSLRPDLVGSELAKELTLLQTQVPADSFDVVRGIVEKELESPLEESFLRFEEVPIASASIGQVHDAVLRDGTRVVVKVQHANIQTTVNEDLEVLCGLAVMAEKIPELAAWQPRTIVDQLARSLRRELSFQRELLNLQVFHRLLSDKPGIRVPRCFAKHSSSLVLTMEKLDGESIHSLAEDTEEGVEQRVEIARRVASLYVDSIFVMGLYHADPHPGNILILPNGDVGLLDFGMVGRIDDTLRGSIEEMLFAVVSQDSALLTSLIKRAGKIPASIDESLLANDVADLIANYASQPIETLDFAAALHDATDILHRHRITLPSQMSILIKTLITLQGTISQLSPGFSILETVQPKLGALRRNRYSPWRQARRMRRLYVEIEGLVERMPSQISSLMELIQEGKLDVQLSHRGLSPSINRLVLGLLTSSLLLGSSILMASKVPPLLFTERGPLGLQDLSLLGLIGFLVSSLVAFRILLAINKSGHLDAEADDHFDHYR